MAIDADWVADQARCAARGHAGRRVQDRRARQRREHRGDRRDHLRLSGRAADPRSGARVGTRRRARQRRDDARDARAAVAADDDPHAEQHGGAAARRHRGRRRAVAARVRGAADRGRVRIRARHRHARGDAAGRQHAVREERHRAHRHVAAVAGQLSRLGLHARLGDRGDARQRPRRCPRRCARRRTTRGTRSRRRIAPAWASIFPTGCSGRARMATRAETDTPRRSRRMRRNPRGAPMPAARTERVRRASRRASRGSRASTR